MDLISYQVDRRDQIVSVDGAWSDFAIENGAPTLAGEAVIGTSLWDYIADPVTRSIYGEIIERVRTRGTSVSLPFRCDAPDLRRFMHMDVVAAGEGLICFVCRVERIEPRPAVAWPVAAAGDDFVRLCSWCHRVEMHGLWCDIETAIAGLDLLSSATPQPFTYGICPDCAERVAASFKS